MNMKRLQLHTTKNNIQITYTLRIYNKIRATIEYPDSALIYRRKSTSDITVITTLLRFFRSNCFIIDSSITIDDYINSI